VGEALGVRREAADPVSPPNKSKEIQRNPRKKAWISLDSFGRIGTYQGVTANPNKKIFSPVTLCLKSHNRLSRAAPARPAGFDQATGQIYSMDSDSRKDICQAFCFPTRRRITIAAVRHVIVMRFSRLLPHRTIDLCRAAI
jgi:hypothetical protein